MRILPKSKKITDIGEFGLIERISGFILKNKNSSGAISFPNSNVIVGIGDDAAVFRPSDKHSLVAVSKDLLIEGVHFKREWSSFFEIGRKAIVANISDIAAIGGASPKYIVVGLAIPVDISVDNVDKLFQGMDKEARQVGAVFIGGDTVKSNKDIVISITIIGEIDKRKIVLRSGARCGDLICVTGYFGDSSAGLDLIKCGGRFDCNTWQGQLVHKYRCPSHRLNEAKVLVSLSCKGLRPSSMVDSSDGLAASLRIITDASSKSRGALIRKKNILGARVKLEKVPLSKAFLKWAESKILKISRRKNPYHQKKNLIEYPKFPWRAILEGGEEYELVFTVAPRFVERLRRLVRFKIIGEITSSGKVEYLLNGKPLATGSNSIFKGYENF